MGVIRFFRGSMLTLALFATGAVPLTVHGQSPAALESEQAKLADLDVQTQKLQRELEFTRYKRESSEEKLRQAQADLRDKEGNLQQLQASLGDSPSATEEETLANEQQRVALAELNIKSIMASVVRLERKEAELQDSLAALESQKQDTTQNIARLRDRARAQADARARQAEAELAALKRENEQLRQAMEEEARRAQQAAEEAERLAQLAALQEHQELQEQLRLEEEREQQLAAESQQAQQTAPEDAVSEEEPPVYISDDGEKVIIRSRSIDEPVVMQPIGPGVYQAEVAVEPGRAYFDVRNKRFRGVFPDSEEPQTFVFRYDASGDTPSFTVEGRAEAPQDPQMFSDSSTAF